jgi:hypothetical protein
MKRWTWTGYPRRGDRRLSFGNRTPATKNNAGNTLAPLACRNSITVRVPRSARRFVLALWEKSGVRQMAMATAAFHGTAWHWAPSTSAAKFRLENRPATGMLVPKNFELFDVAL